MVEVGDEMGAIGICGCTQKHSPGIRGKKKTGCGLWLLLLLLSFGGDVM
jgi:hypothetical protein